MSKSIRERLSFLSRGLHYSCHVRLTHRGRTYIFMEGRWWAAPKLRSCDGRSSEIAGRTTATGNLSEGKRFIGRW